MDTAQIDNAVRNVSAFRSFVDLMHSITTHDYVPTLKADVDAGDQFNRDIATVRACVLAAGGNVFPSESTELPRNRRVVRVRKLTPTMISTMDDLAHWYEGDLAEDYTAARFASNFVEASRRLLDAIADHMEDTVDDRVQAAVGGIFDDNATRAEFATRSVEKSTRLCVERIRRAIS